jgi:hypothetical protein
MDQKPNRSSFETDTHQGTKKAISRSNNRNNTAMTQNFISNACRVPSCGSKPHSYADNFSDSGFCLTKKYEVLIINAAKTIENTKNISIVVYSVLTKELFINNIKLVLSIIKDFIYCFTNKH